MIGNGEINRLSFGRIAMKMPEQRPRDVTPGSSQLEPLLDTLEAAAWLKIHPKTLQRMARRGELRAVQVGKLWRFRSSDLADWISDRIA